VVTARPGPIRVLPVRITEAVMSELIGDGDMAPDHRAGGTASRLSAGEWLLLLVLAAVQFTHIVDFMIIMPLGPVYIREMGLTTGQFSSVIAAYTISAGLAGLLAARFLDHFDRKRALLTLYAGFGAGTLVCALAPGYLALLAARTVAGAFGGVAAAVVLAIVGTNLARTLLERMSDVQFRRWMKALMIAIGAFYLAQGAYVYATR
jgi:MFS family permease